MRHHVTMAALGSLLCLTAADQRPGADEQKRTLDTAREIAIHYTSKLPDFICREDVERSDTTSRNNLQPDIVQTDRLTIQLSYSGQKEKYQLVAINGNKTTQSLASLEGLITGGEFGSLQLQVFDPASAAEFSWKESTTIRKQRAAVYSFKIARAKSHFMVGYRADNGQMVSMPAGYHGEVSLDADTSRVLRLTAEADDMPKGSGVYESSVQVDYDLVDVAGKSHLLPSHSEAKMGRSDRKITNAVTFTGYKKFEADSTIDFKLVP